MINKINKLLLDNSTHGMSDNAVPWLPSATLGTMILTVVMAQADSVASWVRPANVIVQSIGVISTTVLAMIAYRWNRRSATAEQRNREAEQARLMIITVNYEDYEYPHQTPHPAALVVITNQSEQRVLLPHVKLMCGAQPPVRWGDKVPYWEYDEQPYSPPEVLLPGTSHYVVFEHVIDGHVVDPAKDVQKIKKWVDVNDVTITFTNTSGAQWQRTGNSEPIRVKSGSAN